MFTPRTARPLVRHAASIAPNLRSTQFRTMSSPDPDKHSLEYTKARQQELGDNIRAVTSDIQRAYASIPSGPKAPAPRLVAVSKLKPASDIKALYDLGHRHFGENYIQELVDKARLLPGDVCWHFIGGLQSNKAKGLVAAVGEGLWVVETLAAEKTAGLLEKAVKERGGGKLQVYIQVNTSGEEGKSGVRPLTAGEATAANPTDHELVKLATYIYTSCPHLHLLGLMTIGSFEASHDPTHPNPDFESLKTTRHALFAALATTDNPEVKQALPDKAEQWELSMGMSADFEEAVRQGSAGVRVGTRIFGERPKRGQGK